MFSYRHAFHAGNHADVLKHAILVQILDYFNRKDAPYWVIDTHAGAGLYALDGEWAGQSGEVVDGLDRLLGAPRPPELVTRYLRAIQANNPVGGLIAYPGSPLLAAQAMRGQDRMAACELQPEEAAALKELFAHDRRVQVLAANGYDSIRALLPPRAGETKIGRALVLIDPPYEAQDTEYPQIIATLREILARMPQAQCAVWYPVKQRRSLLPFFRKAAALPVKSALVAELMVRPDDSPLRLNGSGMLLLNPPWQFDQALAPALPVLQRELGEAGASTRLEWIKNGD